MRQAALCVETLDRGSGESAEPTGPKLLPSASNGTGPSTRRAVARTLGWTERAAQSRAFQRSSGAWHSTDRAQELKSA